MKRHMSRFLPALGLSLALILPASASGDTLISRSYLENTYRPRLSTVIRDSVELASRPLINAALSRMDRYFTGSAGVWRTTLGFTPQSSDGGDAVALASGAGLFWASGAGSLTDGVLIDATIGREVAVGGSLTAGHRYLADGQVKVSVTAAAQWMAEGQWMTIPGGAEVIPGGSFADVPAGAFYADAVSWAVGREITNGIDDAHFSPESFCKRADIVTFLWRAYGKPEPKSLVSPFTDVTDPGSYYYKAVLWAVEQGITNGMTPTAFDPDSTCTRGQAMTFLYRAEKEPPVSGTTQFTDVPDGQYYTDPVAWAVRLGITNGTDTTHFSPDQNCTRGHIVTFLYRDLG